VALPAWAWHQILIVTVGLLVFFTNLGGPPLWDRDEPRNAGCAEEMLARGDWVVPTFNGRLRDAKAVLLYWLIMSAYGVWGVNEFAARFWSAALAVGTLLATYHLGRRVVSPTAACWGSLILASCLMFDVAARAATPDSLLIFCSTAAMCVYVLGAFPSPHRLDSVDNSHSATNYFPRSTWLVLLMYGLMGLGVLAKGPVGFLLPTAAIGLFLLIMRRNELHGSVHSAAAYPRFINGLMWSYARTSNVPKRSVTDQPAQPMQPMMVMVAGVGLVVVGQVWGLPGLLLGGVAVVMTLSALGRNGWISLVRPFEPTHFFTTAWSMRLLTATFVILTVALPWYVWVGSATEGEFLSGFFLKEHFGRASTAMENHTGSPFFYPIAILIGFFPWSVFAVPIGLDLVQWFRKRQRITPGSCFLLCWSGVIVGAFTIAETKLPSYVTPSYPALALLAGQYVERWLRGESQVSRNWNAAALGSLAGAGLAMTLAIPIAARFFFPGDEFLAVIGLVPIATAAIAWHYLRRDRRRAFATTLAVGAVLFVTVTFGFALERVSQHQQNQRLVKLVRERGEQAGLASFDCLESTWVFYAKRQIQEIHSGPELQATTRRFLEQHPEPYIITTRSRLATLQPLLPADFTVLDEVPYFLRREQLMLLGPDSTGSRYIAHNPNSTATDR